MDQEIRRARHNKFAKTGFGRMRPLDMFYGSGDRGLEAHANRCAVNMLVQGVAADIMKTSMVRIYSWIKNNNLQDDIHMLITMHDEIVFEMRTEKMDLFIPKINNIMSLSDILQAPAPQGLGWPVPLVIDAEYGDSWHVDGDFFKEHPEMKNAPAAVEFHRPEEVSGRYALALGKQPDYKAEHEAIPETLPEAKLETEVPREEPKKEEAVPAAEQPKTLESLAIVAPTAEKTGAAFIDDIFGTEKPEEVVLPAIPAVGAPLPEAAVQTLAPEEVAASDDSYIYTVKKLLPTTSRLFNMAIIFLRRCEAEKIKFDCPYKTLVLKDSEGNSLLVSELKVPVAAFKSLALFLGI